eukprot:CAMPEP_0181326282 /NCGR_PEP_ID=MMETSP1101-20121128/21405_1 /TAXON_ID=46948 /ORGANISM="Rhodomonas abbreviata, Strain Caron Lab Isolate" /LENGTH=576 /DNA_ID=CAMNT_0023434705 /DNA_START=193 /DNA_END=1923 /DNA_ORIENTATION=-
MAIFLAGQPWFKLVKNMRPQLLTLNFIIVMCSLLFPRRVSGNNKIYLGGQAKWYDSFNERLANEFQGTSFCRGKKLPGYGAPNCEVNDGCCYVPPVNEFQPETEDCVPCQEIRGTWQGILGTCIYEDIETVVEFDIVRNVDKDPVITTRCVPSVVDPTLLVFEERGGKMATGVAPSSSPGNTGQFSFEFLYNRAEDAGDIDLFIATFLGTRILFGKYEVEVSELGTTLNLAIGASRSQTATPQRTSGILPLETQYVFFEGFLVSDFQPKADTYANSRLPEGSCKHVVTPGEDMDAIARRYMLTWQEVFAFNSQFYDPGNLKPGDVVAVGRHHTVKGPCINLNRRQSGPLVTDVSVDSSCTCSSLVQCRAAEGRQLGETLFGIASRYGTSWQRVVDMNPQLQGCDASSCKILPGDMLCIVPYFRNVLCETEYRRYPVVDNNGNSPGYLETFFSCQPKWQSQLTVDKCCQVPRCKCCTSDSYSGMYSEYNNWESAPTANTCDVTAVPHKKCLDDPLIPDSTGRLTYSLLCDNDCQLLCDKLDPTTPDPNCPLAVGLETYTGLCVERRMLDGSSKRVCT